MDLDRLADLGAREVLLAVEANRAEQMQAEADLLALAAHWCDLHGEVRYDDERRVRCDGDAELVGIGGKGTPWVEEFCAAEFGAMRHQHPTAARNLMADSLDLRHRLPRLWSAVQGLRLDAWVARRVARDTRKLDARAAGYVDAAVAPFCGTLPAGRFLDLVAAKVIEADPATAEEARRHAETARFVRTKPDGDGLSLLIARAHTGDIVVFAAMVERIAQVLVDRADTSGQSAPSMDERRARAVGILGHPAEALQLLLDAAQGEGVPDAEVDHELDPDETLRGALARVDAEVLRPQVRLFAHLTDDALRACPGVGRVVRLEGHGPITVGQLRDWLASSDAHVTVTPVLDIADQRPVDGYEFPARIVESLHQRMPADPFPWSVNTSRRKDTDHSVPYVPPSRGGPPGQTGVHNGARLTRQSHRLKTHGEWRLIQPKPGLILWRSPHGFWFRTDHHGTTRTGHHGVIWLVS
ncbi:hypothetical protein [Nocardioides terrisoli]|uniref:hypothetical protein n=1 Tax=Nocardioides terrisoli TaxID=3388267 RepID=UPI00287BA501|nr:hypothetical protein [Nocardioides marmorisolisilvae]